MAKNPTQEEISERFASRLNLSLIKSMRMCPMQLYRPSERMTMIITLSVIIVVVIIIVVVFVVVTLVVSEDWRG